MPDGQDAVTLKLLPRIAAVGSRDWDSCAGQDNPFVSHAFLSALEDSGSVGPGTGWQPQHLVAEEPDGGLAGAMPMYLKSHSYGEYVFDHAWAHAYERAGGRYYPKLQIAVPFTPVPGPRLLVGAGGESIAHSLILAAQEVARRHKASSVHVTFPHREDWERFGAAGWLQRVGVQYHWENQGYRSFDDFLSSLNSRKRKAIRKERREAAESGVVLHTMTGGDLRAEHWDAFFRFYMDTSDRKWGSPYLTRDFFDRLGSTMADRVVLMLGELNGRWVCGALNLLGSDTLYGRNWGCLGDFKFLHFEACYYRAIEFAIEHGLKRVEAGAQGQHKIQRGYLPVETYSAHWIADASFREAVADFLRRERQAISLQIAELAEGSPFRQEGSEPA